MEIIISILMIIFILLLLLNSKPNKKYKKQKQEKYNSHKYIKKKEKDFFNKQKKHKTTYKEKIKKGRNYELYIIDHFKSLGWTVWDHAGEKGKKDAGIDLIIKKDTTVYFVQCKNWEDTHSYKMGLKKIKTYQEKAKEYMKKNKRISRLILDLNYTIKLIFISSKDIYTNEAKSYINENNDILGYQVIPMKD